MKHWSYLADKLRRIELGIEIIKGTVYLPQGHPVTSLQRQENEA